MLRVVTVFCLFFISVGANAQFWIGPKAGIHIPRNMYKNDSTRIESDISNDLGWHAGISIDYVTEGRFGVHTEIQYENVSSNISHINVNDSITSTSKYHFISAPMLVRMMFGYGQLKFYLQGGPKIKYWIGGSGTFSPNDDITVAGRKYKVGFKNGADRSTDIGEEDAGNGKIWQTGHEFIVEKPNRIQYALDFGAGVFFDIADEQRINLDIRYSFGHSNMGFNVDRVTDVPGHGIIGYQEDLEYSHNMLMVSVAYLIGYSPVMQKKGKSTIKRK